MSRLVDSYLGALPVGSDPPEGDIEQRLADLFARGRAAHPSFCVDDVSFARHLARCGGPLDAAATALEAEDLYLACAALAGDDGAVAEVRRKCWPVVLRHLRLLGTPSTFVDDVEQSLWEALLVGRADAAPKLASYSGRGPLAGFVGISAQRLALTVLRRDDVQARAQVRRAAETDAVARDVELGLLKERYRDAFQQAVQEALQVLSDRERMILRMYVVDNLTLDRVAKVYDVSQSTVSRWLGAARKRVLAEARGRLRRQIPLSDSDFDSLLGLLASQLDVSLSQLLAAAG